MQFQLKHLGLLVLLFAGAMGGYQFGRKTGRTERQPEIDRLNLECADIMEEANMFRGTIATPNLLGKTAPVARTFDFRKPEDRATYRDLYGRKW